MLNCEKCQHPHLTSSDALKLKAALHTCQGCGYTWGGSPKVVGNPLAAVLTPAVISALSVAHPEVL